MVYNVLENRLLKSPYKLLHDEKLPHKWKYNHIIYSLRIV